LHGNICGIVRHTENYLLIDKTKTDSAQASRIDAEMERTRKMAEVLADKYFHNERKFIRSQRKRRIRQSEIFGKAIHKEN